MALASAGISRLVEPPLNRRQACVVSLDVVGFSRMMARNDMAAVRALRYCRRIVEQRAGQFGGRLFGSAGDSFMIEFPAADRAVRCSVNVQVDIQDWNRTNAAEDRLFLRAGIDAGDVIDDDGNLYGDVVNIAARLQEVCSPGGIVVSLTIQTEVAGRIDLRAAGELSLKNIAVPVEIFEVMESGEPLGSMQSDPASIDFTRQVPGFEGAPVLAILPLENATGDLDQEHVCRGFSEDLITSLSRMRQFTIIDRNTTFAHRSGDADAQAVGRRLGARYLLEGKLEPGANYAAVSMRLTDLDSGRSVWSDRYDRNTDDFLSTVDDAALRVSATLGGRIERAEGARFRARRESRVGARGLLWRSRWHLDQLTSRDAEEALRLLQDAEQRDPSNPEVLIQLAHWHWVDAWSMRRPMQTILDVRKRAVAARDADLLDGRGHMLVGVCEILLKNLDEALVHLREAAELNPSLAMTYAQIGSCYNLKGDYAKAIPQLELSLRLSPEDYYVFYVFGELAISYCLLGDWPRAIAYARKALTLRPSYWNARMSEIAALWHSGDPEGAALSVQTLMFRTPKFTLRYVDWLPYDANSVRAFFADAIRKAQNLAATMS